MDQEGTIISEHTPRNYTKILLLLLLAILLLAGGYAGYKALKPKEVIQENAPTPLTERAGGTLYLSGSGSDPSHVSSLYSLEIASGEIIKVDPEELSTSFTEHLSPDETKSVYTTTKVLTDEWAWPDPLTSQIMVYDSVVKNISALTSSATYKKNPEWSPDGNAIVYMTRDYGAATNTDEIDQWSIFVVDATGTETFITTGMLPQWFPDGVHLLVLKSDGLYIFDKNTKEGMRIPEVYDGQITSNMKIDLSRDGSKLVMTIPDLGQVLIAKINSVSPLSVELVDNIQAHAFWPIFSEDGKYLVLHEVNWGALDTNPQPRLMLYDLETLESEMIKELSGLDPESIAVTDWRY